MWGYRRRVLLDVARWKNSGWISASAHDQILADVEGQGGSIHLANVLAMLASVLLGFAAISFVAAHWNEIGRLWRLVLLCGLIWAGYGAAGFFQARNRRGFADAAMLFAVAMFGASIMLISQMFHIDGNPPDGVLLWGAGALLAGVLLRSNAALALAMVLAVIWGWLEAEYQHSVYWPFLVAWGVIATAFAWQRWTPGLHLSGLALSLFVVFSAVLLDSNGSYSWHFVTAIGLAAAVLGIAGERWAPASPAPAFAFWQALLDYGALVAFAGLLGLQFAKDPDLQTFVILAAFALTLLIGLIAWGLSSHNRVALWLGYIGFSIEILSVYAKTAGTLLDTSVLFLVAAIIVAGLAFMAWRLHQRETQTPVLS